MDLIKLIYFNGGVMVVDGIGLGFQRCVDRAKWSSWLMTWWLVANGDGLGFYLFYETKIREI